jgi:outer membrane protein OmpA-like peptidoglycan-associated protein
MTLRSLLAAATCLALPLAAPLAAQAAAPVSGPYIDAGFGASFQQDTNVQSSGPLTLRSTNTAVNGYVAGKITYKPAFAGVGDVGYGFGNGFRVQVGGNFYHNGGQNSDGDASTYGVMVNGLYDFPVNFPLVPYLGAGAGYQWQKLDIHNDSGQDISGSSGSVAYDVIAGAAYNVPNVPGLAITGEYRFMQLVQTRHYQYSDDFVTARLDAGKTMSHTILIGLRYQLFQPPAALPIAPAPYPVAAPAAPLPARTFLVFFDWDKADVSARASQIIAEAASDSKTAGVTTLDVSGYTDTSGTADYNQGLSERRAKSVAAALVQDGVPESEIEIHAYGETHLLVATGPGVREPQNRRVEIVLN